MHICPPPKDEFKKRFTDYPDVNGGFGHTLLEQLNEDDGSLADILKEYFESAHLDARNIFHANIGIDLHPDAAGDEPVVVYPGSLPSTTRRGLFGEVMAGLLSETYKYVGGHTWCVPIFLFRHHEDVFQYLFSLVRDPEKKRQTIGRLGSDFIGLALDDERRVVRIISGEAKWRKTLTQGVVDTLMLGDWVAKDKSKEKSKANRKRSGKGVWYYVNSEPTIPSGARQLQRLLQEHDPDGYDATILSLQRALVAKNPEPIPKTDLVVVIGNGGKEREKRACLLPIKSPPPEYTAGNDLQIMEVILTGGEDLIDAIYANLWKEGENA
ncbi:MAG: aminotransferase [Hoeflea sp.]|uniref:aminotransferase n=1 Tax=Hoeflea sp. TaxID=1940281 RepID=UPI003EF426A7